MYVIYENETDNFYGTVSACGSMLCGDDCKAIDCQCVQLVECGSVRGDVRFCGVAGGAVRQVVERPER